MYYVSTMREIRQSKWRVVNALDYHAEGWGFEGNLFLFF